MIKSWGNSGWSHLIRDIDDLTDVTYSVLAGEQIKAETPFLSTTEGINNPIYGIMPWVLGNYNVGPYVMGPKDVYRKSGFRVQTGRAVMSTVNGNTIYGGMAENGKLPEITSIPVEEHDIDPKIMAMSYGNSLKHELLANSEDDTYGGLAQITNRMSYEYSYFICDALMRNQETVAAAATGNFDYDAQQDITNYDQAISNSAEEDAHGGGTHSGLYDVYGEFDRDTGTTYDSTVISASGGNIGSGIGTLDRDHFSSLNADIEELCGRKPSVYLAQTQVRKEIKHLFDGQARYGASGMTVGVSVNGVTAPGGRAVQLEVGTVEDIPIISTHFKCAPTSDPNQAGTLFAFDLEYTNDMEHAVSFSMLLPTVYIENTPNGGAGSAWGWVGRDLIQRAALVSIQEFKLSNPQGCGKLTDIALRS